MKKILFLMLSLAVTTSAFAGVKVNSVQKTLPQTSKAAKVSHANGMTAAKDVQTMNINAPKVTPKQHQLMPIEGMRVLEAKTNMTFNAPHKADPAGTGVNYKRSAGQFLAPNEGLTALSFGQQAGTIKAVENGNKIYFKNLLYDPNNYLLANFVQYGASGADYWIEGTKSGNTITIQLGQTIVDLSAQGLNIVLKRGTTRSTSSGVGFSVNSATTATFTVNGDVLTLNNSSQSTTGYGNGLAAVWDDDNTWANVINYGTQLTAIGEIPDAPVIYTDADIDALTGEIVRYNRTGYAWNRTADNYLDIMEQRGYGYIFYDEDGSTVYMRDPVSGWNNGNWVKGTKNGDQLSFPLNQYFYWDDEFFGIRTTYGLLELDTITNKLTYTIDPDKTDITYTIEGNCITMDDCGYVDDAMTQFYGLAAYVDSAYIDRNFYCMDWFTQYYMIPGTPTIESVQPVTATTATVNWTDADANTDTWNVRYREWVDPATVEYFFDDFEGEVNWTGWNMDGDDYWWELGEDEDGNTMLSSASYVNNVGPLEPDNWVMSPELKLDGVIRFKAWGQDPKYAAENIAVYVFVGDTATIEDPATAFVKVGDDIVTTGDVTEYTFVIPEEYQGQMGYIAIRHYNVTDMFRVNIDDVYVGSPDGGNPWIYVNGVQAMQLLLEGLTPSTTYEVQVQGTNYGGVGVWSDAVQFTTLADQPQPTVLRGDVDGNGEVTMDDLSLLINYMVDPLNYIDLVNFDNTAICDDLGSGEVGMDDLSALINFMVAGAWAN